MFDEASGIAAADDGGGALLLADELGSDGASCGVGGILGFTQETVPDDGVGVDDVVGELGSRERADVKLVTFGIFVEIFGDVDIVGGWLITISGDLAADDDIVGELGEFVD